MKKLKLPHILRMLLLQLLDWKITRLQVAPVHAESTRLKKQSSISKPCQL
jgi:hypothetical protein